MSTGTSNCASPDLDAVLPAGITCAPAGGGGLHRVLLTGATGFLGRQMLCQLLETTSARVTCIVRATGADAARERIRDALRAVRGPDADPGRIDVLCGDIAAPGFGLGAETYASCLQDIDAVFHCAAEVNWVRGYGQLRRANVLGMLEVIRFACAVRAKPVTFVSSLAVCFARDGPAYVEEDTDMAPWLDAMPLGYARSKCVAESLLRQAARRGLAVAIVRPGLLSGDTGTGASNPADVVGAVIEGCVARGEAPDADWYFDIVPVDYAARAIVALGLGHARGLATFHLRHARPRHWRELVLWLHLMGYPLRLIPTGRWLERTFAEGRGGVLSSYRRFFRGARAAPSTRAPYEVYLAPAQETVACEKTRARLVALGIQEPPLDCELLRRYADHYARVGRIPPRRATPEPGVIGPDPSLRHAVERELGAGAFDWERRDFDGQGGILHEIAALRLGPAMGLHRYSVRPAGEPGTGIDVLVKAKVRDEVAEGLVAEIGALCDPVLGRALAEHPQALGLRRSHLREPAIHRHMPAPARQLLPRFLGACPGVAESPWSFATQFLSDAETVDGSAWGAARTEAAVEGAAILHAAWYAQESRLLAQEWAAPDIGAAGATAMTPLWQALASFAEPQLSSWMGTSIAACQRTFIHGIADWWDELASLPRTLVHNDFNPRNLGFVRVGGWLEVRAFDWELSRIGVPQHDLAELLCFAFPADGRREDLARWLELHRVRLMALTGRTIAPEDCVRGFTLALRQLLVERFPLYVLAHRFKPQPFLPAVARNWARLHALSVSLASARGSVRAA